MILGPQYDRSGSALPPVLGRGRGRARPETGASVRNELIRPGAWCSSPRFHRKPPVRVTCSHPSGGGRRRGSSRTYSPPPETLGDGPRARDRGPGRPSFGAFPTFSDYNCDQVVALRGVVCTVLFHEGVGSVHRYYCFRLREAPWTISRCRTLTQDRHPTPRSAAPPRAIPARRQPPPHAPRGTRPTTCPWSSPASSVERRSRPR